MALLYDAFGIRNVEVAVNFWPDFDSFSPGFLSELYGHLNRDDDFGSCDLRSNFGARFDGEHWGMDIDSSSVTLRCSSFATPDELRARMKKFLSQTRDFFSAQPSESRIAYFADQVRMFATVPEDKARNVGEIVLKRLVTRIKPTDLQPLTGLSGAGLRLTGDTADYHWHVILEPPHAAYDRLLGLSLQLLYPVPADPPNPSNDLAKIDAALAEAYSFLAEKIKTFAETLIH